MIRDEVPVNSKKGNSMDKISSRMMTRQGFLMSAFVIAGMVLGACNQLSIPGLTINVTPFRSQVTEASPVGVTPKVSETPFVEMTMTEIPESSEYVEINMRIREFLNSEGAFTEEALAELPHMGYGEELMEGNYLGIMYTQTSSADGIARDSMNWNGYGTQIYFQGVFLGSVMDEDEMIILMGMIDKNMSRVIVPIGRKIYPQDGDVPANISNICRFDGGARDVAAAGFSNLYLYLGEYHELQRMIGSAALFSCSPQEFSGPLKESFNGYGVRAEDKLVAISQSVTMCRKLYNIVADVRGEGGEIVENAESEYSIYDESTYPGIRSIVENDDPNLYYVMTIFVTR